jgi:hypothetical protein
MIEPKNKLHFKGGFNLPGLAAVALEQHSSKPSS